MKPTLSKFFQAYYVGNWRNIKLNAWWAWDHFKDAAALLWLMLCDIGCILKVLFWILLSLVSVIFFPITWLRIRKATPENFRRFYNARMQSSTR